MFGKIMGKYISQNSNDDRESYCRYLCMSPERFVHLFNHCWYVNSQKRHELQKKYTSKKKPCYYTWNVSSKNFECFFECITIISSYFIDFKLSPETGDRKYHFFHLISYAIIFYGVENWR